MNNAITHYQTSFRIGGLESLNDLKGNVFGWIKKGEPDRRINSNLKEFFFRCDWQNMHVTRSSLITNTFFSDSAEAWAARYTQIDAELGRKRYWYSDIGFKRSPDSTIVSVRISYAWNTEDLSGSRQEPTTNVPKVVRYLLDGRLAYSGRPEFRLTQAPALFAETGMGNALAEFVLSPHRRYPLVVFNGDFEAMINEANLLAFELTGKAQVAILSSRPGLAEEFKERVGELFYVNDGFFRVYFPFNRGRNSPERHRWFDIRRDGYADQREGLVYGLLRNHNLSEKESVETVEDISRLIGLQQMLKVKAANPEQQKQLEEFLDEHSKVALERDQAKQEAEAYASEIDGLEKVIADLQFKDQALQQRLNETHINRNDVVYEILPQLPETLCDVVEAAKRCFPNLDFASEAIKSAKEYCDCKSLNEAWEMLILLDRDVHRLKFVGTSSVDWVKYFADNSRFGLAMSEGRQTQKDNRLMRLRTIVHKGRNYDITPHLKFGNTEPRMVRIHFAFDEQQKKVVIGYVGPHLENATSRKLN